MATILVIDDEPGIIRMVRAMLEAAGHRVVDAPDGRLGLKLFEADPPDLVIVDLLMPEQEGIETIRAMRQRSSTLPIIAMSGGAFEVDYLDHARQFGADAVLRKPFRAEELHRLVRQALDRSAVEP